jgi:hypothetical protein
MKNYQRNILLAIAVFSLLVLVWILLNRPARVDMAEFVPADSLIFVEVNDVMQLLKGIRQTKAWENFGEYTKVHKDLNRLLWFGPFFRNSSIGPAEAIILSRAQVAITINGFDMEEREDSLNIRPRLAVLIETNTGEWRTRAALRRVIGRVAGTLYGNAQVEESELDGARFTTWASKDEDRRIIAAVMDTFAVVGNNLDLVRSCLAVRKGEQPGLVNNLQLIEFRRKLHSETSLASGFVSNTGAQQLTELLAKAYIGDVSDDPRAQGMAASLLPQISSRILGKAGMGWSTRLKDGIVEDHYSLSLEQNVTSILKDSNFEHGNPEHATTQVSQLLPSETYSFTLYNYSDPLAIWKALNKAVASQLDTLSAIFVTEIFKESLKTYGIQNPELFLRTVGPGLTTARVDEAGDKTLVIVKFKDRAAAQSLIDRRLGTPQKSEQIGDHTLLISSSEERGAASFISDYILIGTVEGVRESLERVENQKIISTVNRFKMAYDKGVKDQAHIVTYKNEESATLEFFRLLSPVASEIQSASSPKIQKKLEDIPHSLSMTRVLDGELERKTYSPMGSFSSFARIYSATSTKD